jgi:hypothetical protein
MPIISGGRIIEGSGLGHPLLFAGVPVSGVGGTYAGIAQVGSQLIDTVNGEHYMCTAYVAGTNTITWQLTAVQT